MIDPIGRISTLPTRTDPGSSEPGQASSLDSYTVSEVEEYRKNNNAVMTMLRKEKSSV